MTTVKTQLTKTELAELRRRKEQEAKKMVQ